MEPLPSVNALRLDSVVLPLLFLASALNPRDHAGTANDQDEHRGHRRRVEAYRGRLVCDVEGERIERQEGDDAEPIEVLPRDEGRELIVLAGDDVRILVSANPSYQPPVLASIVSISKPRSIPK
jgi:hypothetical protein